MTDSFSKELRMTGLRTALRREARAIALIASVTAVYAVFRVLVTLAVPPPRAAPMPLGAVPAALVADFAQHFAAGLVMWAVIQPVRHRGPSGGAPRVVAVALAVFAGAVIAATARTLWLADTGADPSPWASWHIFFIRFGLLAGMLVVVGEFHRTEVRSLEAMRTAEAERSVLEQQTLQARLRVLEAQIEPHFLFNTLANVRRLYETDAATGEAMLDRLIRYLEVALPSMRSDHSTLARESELLSAYLDLQRVRMGRRLDYSIDIPPSLARLEVPPMMLLTLVENAIKHGLAPLREGGRVDIAATADASWLQLRVSDTGRGFGGGTSGGGTGLANIRARLAAMFGGKAELELMPREPRGIVAAIRMPIAAYPA